MSRASVRSCEECTAPGCLKSKAPFCAAYVRLLQGARETLGEHPYAWMWGWGNWHTAKRIQA